jgi:hypothetical protein
VSGGVRRREGKGAAARFAEIRRYPRAAGGCEPGWRSQITTLEAGTKLVTLPTRTIKPSQRCCRCGKIHKHALADRTYRCGCGNVMDRSR